MGLKGSTCFILGAGASNPFGFPLGAELRLDIIHRLNIGKCKDPYYRLVAACGFDDDKIADFRCKLLFTDYSSVDYFVEKFPEYLDIGKICMATSLLQREHREVLFIKSDWYKTFLAIVEEAERAGELSRISVVTFNYDRSLEYYLVRAVSMRRRVTLIQAAECLRELKIVHVYGWLGNPFDPVADSHLAYAEPLSVPVVRRAAGAIKIMPEATGDEDHFVAIQNILTRSEQLVFLGFDFHEVNMRRIGFLSPKPDWVSGKKCFVTASGMPARMWTSLREEWLGGFGAVSLSPATAKDCLDNWVF